MTTFRDLLAADAERLRREDPPRRRCETCDKPCTYPLGVAGYCLRCMVEKMHHNPGLYGQLRCHDPAKPDYGRPTTKGAR